VSDGRSDRAHIKRLALLIAAAARAAGPPFSNARSRLEGGSTRHELWARDNGGLRTRLETRSALTAEIECCEAPDLRSDR